MDNYDLTGLDSFIEKMQQSLTTYELLLEDEKTRSPGKGSAEVQPGYYKGCVHVLQSLLYLSSDIKRRNDEKLAKKLAKERAERNG